MSTVSTEEPPLSKPTTRRQTVQARLGHASASETLDTYRHLWPDNDERTRAAVDGVLRNFADHLRTNGVPKHKTAVQRPESG